MPLMNNALTTIEAVKKNITNKQLGDEDIAFVINQTSEFIERYCKRKFGRMIYQEKYNGSGGYNLKLNQYPATSVYEIKINGEVINPNSYDLINEYGLIDFSFILQKSRLRNIDIKYEAGYILPKDNGDSNARTLPFDIECACIMLATMNCQNGDGVGLQRRAIGDYSETFLNDIPRTILYMLDNHKKKNI